MAGLFGLCFASFDANGGRIHLSLCTVVSFRCGYIRANEQPHAFLFIMSIEFKDVIDTRQLADFLGIEYKKLTYILYAERVENLYKSFEIPKKNGEMRCLNAPLEPLKHVQRILAQKLMVIQEKNYLKSNEIVHGFTRHRGIITNSKNHRNKRYVLNLDLEDFFDSFHFGRVKGYFQKNRNFMLPEDVAACIANLACYNGKLPQGAPSSPVITNLICCILDRRLAAIAKKYRMTYTRYADDLTFSTNSKLFLNDKDKLLSEVYAVIQKSGFTVNQSKTRVSFRDSRQEVTGLVVNQSIGIKREFYKETRSMLDHLYRGLPVEHNGVEVSQKQIEGRLAFINQIDKYNNVLNNKNKRPQSGLNARERQYQQFLFYKYFFAQPKPVIVTEGKTDNIYIRAALQQLYKKYPALIKKEDDGTFEYLVSFLKKTKRLEFFLGIQRYGADTMKNIYNAFTGANGYPNLFASIKGYGSEPQNPVILMFDNELNSNRPLKKFIDYTKTALEEELSKCLLENLYISTIPLVKGKTECEIEDLFHEEVLNHEIDGKRFDRKGKDSDKHYSKQVFATYVAENMNAIDFSNFVPLLDELSAIVTSYKARSQNR